MSLYKPDKLQMYKSRWKLEREEKEGMDKISLIFIVVLFLIFSAI